MRTRVFSSALCVIALAVFSLAGRSAEPMDQDAQDFIKTAAVAGVAEAELGKIGEQKATSNDVKTFAQKMVHDHIELNTKVVKLAHQKGIKVGQDMRDEQQKDATKFQDISKLNGAEFDKAFVNQMVADHQKAIDLFENEAKNGQDEDVKNLAQTALPVLQAHLKHAQDLQTHMSQNTSNEGQPQPVNVSQPPSPPNPPANANPQPAKPESNVNPSEPNVTPSGHPDTQNQIKNQSEKQPR